MASYILLKAFGLRNICLQYFSVPPPSVRYSSSYQKIDFSFSERPPNAKKKKNKDRKHSRGNEQRFKVSLDFELKYKRLPVKECTY